MAAIVKQGAVSTDHPIVDVLAIDLERSSWFAVRKRRDHAGRAEKRIATLEELFPGGNGLVPPVQRIEIVNEARWLPFAVRLRGADHHANQFACARQFPGEIELRQSSPLPQSHQTVQVVAQGLPRRREYLLLQEIREMSVR